MNENTNAGASIWPVSTYVYDEQLPADSQMLRDLLDGTEFNELFESFYAVLGIPIAIIDLRANVLFSSHWRRICTHFHRVHPETCRRCIESDQQIMQRIRAGQKHVVCHCANGLTDCASPIVIEGCHIANLFFGQFFTEPPDEQRFVNQARTWGLDETGYLEALREVSVVDAARIPLILDLLSRMTRVVTILGVERKRAMDAQARHALILDTIPQSVFWKDPQGGYLGCNRAFLNATGLATQEELIGRTDYDLPWWQLAEDYRLADRTVVADGQPQLHIVEPLRRADGASRIISTAKLPLLDASRRICGVLGIYEDITEAEQARAELLAAKEQFRTAFMTSLDAFYIATLEEGLIIEANDELTALTGWEHQELIGRTSLELGLYDDGTERAQIVAALKANGFVRNRELWCRRKDRKRQLVSLSIRTMQIGDRALTLGAMRDITDSWRSQQRSESLTRLYAMLSGINEAIARGERPVLEEACRLAVEAGRFRMAWIGMGEPGHDLLPVASAGFVEGYLDAIRIEATGERALGPSGRCRDTGEHALSRDISTDPAVAPWRDAALARDYRSSSAFPIKVGAEVIGVFTVYGQEPSAFSDDELALLDEFALDIGFALERARSEAHRLTVEQALAESEHRFRQIAETIDEVFWVIDPISRTTLYVSPAYEKIWGQPCVVPMASMDAFLASVHPEDLARVKKAVEHKLPRGDYDETYRITRPDGSERWIHDRAFLVPNSAGRPVRIIGTASDVTDRQMIEAQFRQVQKMEAIGVLAGGIAHDFNNILALILSYAALLDEDMKPDDPARADVKEIQSAAQRAAELTRQLLAFSRQQVMELRLLDLNDVVAGMTKMLRRVIGEDIRLTVTSLPGPAMVYADPGQIEQVLMNLAVNARDAMPAGGTLTVEVDRTILDEPEATRVALNVGCYVTLRVSDTGHGIDKMTQARIFEPFFTTKPVGKGTGLGLPSVFGIVKQSGGGIAVESEPGKGATFLVWLPCAAEQMVQPASEPPLPAASDGTGTILLVEDEERVRKLVLTILTRKGYEVLEAPTGGEAIQLCERYKGQIDLIITDVVMPVMSGNELVQVLRQIQPNLRVLLMSGYSDKATGAGAITAPVGFLRKPFTPEILLGKVSESLAVAPGKTSPP